MLDAYKIHVSKVAGSGLTLQTESALSGFLIVATLIGLVILTSVICFYIARYFILRIVEKLSQRPTHKWLKSAYDHRVFHKLSWLVPAAIIYASAPMFATITITAISMMARPLEVGTTVFMIGIATFAFSAFLNSIEDRYKHFKFAKQRPIKSYLQVAKIVVFSLMGLIVISILLSKSPGYFLTGIGAMTAVIVLVFRDSILGFVASIQLAAYDMVRLGDWIEIPGFGVDGNIIEISLNSIKVRNFDNTIVMMPSYALLTSGVKNWRGMTDAGSRRIKRSVQIELSSIKFCNAEFMKKLKETELIKPWLKQQDINKHNEKSETNLGLFRNYIQDYIMQHPSTDKNQLVVVRELEAQGGKGLPFEIYVFCNDTRWENYENFLSGLVEHIYASMPLFELNAFCK